MTDTFNVFRDLSYIYRVYGRLIMHFYHYDLVEWSVLPLHAKPQPSCNQPAFEQTEFVFLPSDVRAYFEQVTRRLHWLPCTYSLPLFSSSFLAITTFIACTLRKPPGADYSCMWWSPLGAFGG